MPRSTTMNTRAAVPATVLACLAWLACAAQPACSRTQPPPPANSLGNVMVEVGHRFETAGRAAAANRFELAEFEVGELGEVFENDVPGAALPKEGPTAHIPTMAKAFLATNVPELQAAAHAHDAKKFADAFAHAAGACNGCHTAAEKSFIQVPTVPGKSVPDVDPR